MAGIVAGLTFGIAKKTTIRCVKIKDENEEIAVSRMEDAARRVIDQVNNFGEPSVALMSFIAQSESIDPIVCTPPVNCDHLAYVNMHPTGNNAA
jgi:hypothetical protein